MHEVFDDVTIILSRGGTVVGQVLRADGTPAAGASVRLAPLKRAGGVVRLPNATTGPDGGAVFTISIPYEAHA